MSQTLIELIKASLNGFEVEVLKTPTKQKDITIYISLGIESPPHPKDMSFVYKELKEALDKTLLFKKLVEQKGKKPSLKNLQIMKLLNRYSGSGSYYKDVENLVNRGCPDELAEAILEMAMLAEQPENFKILYPESEVI